MPAPPPSDDSSFASVDQLRTWCDRVGGAGLRSTGSAVHTELLDWLEDELQAIPGLRVRTDEFELLRWQPLPPGGLEHAGSLVVDDHPVAVAGAVPYSAPAAQRGPLTYLPPGVPITAGNAAGAVVLRDFPDIPIPYDALIGLGVHASPDLDDVRGTTFDRPGLADSILHEDLRAAHRAGAAGLIVAFDLPREQVAGYFEPHKGTHYGVPAVFVGVDEREHLRAAAASQVEAEVTVRAEVGPATTRNVIATLPGRTAERIVVVTHTDGNTWVQENGIAALLAIGHALAALPIERRHRTVELAFTTAHLHIAREGAARYAEQLDAQYGEGTVACVVALEHLGAREIVPVTRTDGPGRRLAYTDAGELVLWAVGPSAPLRRAVLDAVDGRKLDRTLVLPGIGTPVEGQVPPIASFGGLGTYFHTHLIPTTSAITGPWSLWAPAFGADALDIDRYRNQAVAAVDVIRALDEVPLDELAGDYLEHRRARAAGAATALDPVPDEVDRPAECPDQRTSLTR